MRNTTNKNFQNRFLWLQKALCREIQLSKSDVQGISSMKSFCQFEINGWFTRISLNSLKTAASLIDQGEQDNDLWSNMKTMRAQLFTLYTPNSTQNSAPPLPPLEDQLRIALLETHIISMAYYDLFNFMNLIAEHNSKDANQILASICLKIKTSKAKYQTYLSTHDAISSDNLQVIQGGKSND